MPQQAAANLENGGRPSSERKRKLQARNGQAVTSEEAAAPPKQQTISDLFSTSEQKASLRHGSGPELSPNGKRQKLKHNSSPPQPPAIGPAASALSADKMYSFPSKNGVNGTREVIDLTKGSPSNSPRKNSMQKPLQPSLNPSIGPKKLVVKNLKTTTRSDPTQYLNSTWEKLEAAIDIIFDRTDMQQPFNFSMNELYRSVENVCKQGNAAELCARMEKKCKTHMANGLRARLLEKLCETSVDLLRAVISTWERWSQQLMTITKIFYYMDRAYLLQSGLPSLRDKGISWFRSEIFEDDRLKGRIIGGAIDLVSADRAGESPDLSVFREAINLFHEISVYTKTFEPRLLEQSQTFIYEWAEKAVDEQSTSDYVKSSAQLISNELKRCEMFHLDTSTRRDLLALLETHLVSNKEKQLVNAGAVGELLGKNAVSDLEQLYALLQRRRLGKHLRPPFAKWVETTGTGIVFDEKEQNSMVVRLLTLKKQLDNIWRTSFKRDPEIGIGLREAFETFMNKTQKSSGTWNTENSKPGEMIAKYIDMLLRGGSKAIPAQLSAVKTNAGDDEDAEDVGIDEESVVNDQLDQVLDLFRFVHGKAVFEAFYKKDLSRRLLMNRSASDEAERSMLQRLKTECGAGFTQNLEQMFRDCELAREEMKSYNELMSERSEKTAVDLNVNVLSASAWPTYGDIPINIPMDIRYAIEKYEQHYKSKHSGRKLDWKHHLAHCQMKANFPKGKKEIVLSCFQAIVLLLFNGVSLDEQISYEQLRAETGLPELELNRTLQSLACAKLRPLNKHPKGRDINPTDSFTLNANFEHPKNRFKINQIQLKETPQENKDTHERVAVERTFETQAAIVRIMKSRKTITHNELVAEVITATKSRGVLPVGEIKKNIDRLIDKDYMEREDDGMYSYVA